MYQTAPTSVAQTLVELPGHVDNLLLLLSDKEKAVVTKRFSLGTNKKSTLEEIGQDFSVTRERVRQIEKNALSKMRRNVFNTALNSLHQYVLTRVDENGGLIKETLLHDALREVLPKGVKTNENHIHFSLVLHENLECIGNTVNFFPYVRKKNLSDYSLKYACNQLVNLLHKYGDVRECRKVHEELRVAVPDATLDFNMFKSLLGIDKRLALLDDELVGLITWRHIHPRTLRDKILFILRAQKRPMHFTEIAEKIEGAKFDGRPVNLQAVHNELIRHDNFILIGRGIYALEEWGYERGTVADVIEKILEKDKELSQDEIIRQVLLTRQVKKITIMLALKNSAKFERIGRRRYKAKA